MRGTIPNLISAHPIGLELPGLYHDDEFAQSFTSALDDVLAPVFCTLDSLWAYLDPSLTPDDFLDWLAGWVGIALDETWPIDKRRTLIAHAVELYRWRGTVRGLAAHVAVYTGSEPEIIESGGVSWSGVPGGALPGVGAAALIVRVTTDDPDRINERRLDAIVASAKPAHVVHRVEVVRG